jgi:tetratricopeptide (TPR) repeat protein
MKSKLQWIVIPFALSICAYIFNLEGVHKKTSLLDANLSAAVALENSFLSTCGTKAYDNQLGKLKTPLFEGLGDHSFPISTTNSEVQAYFNQGVNLTFGFNHTEAHRAFLEASLLEEESAMSYWGQAYVLGPNINDYELAEARKRSAYDAIIEASNRLTNANELEKSLIQALKTRFVLGENDSISLDNENYMFSMEKLAQAYPKNADVQTLYAASIMNTMPWNYWEKDMSPRENTLKAKEALERGIAANAKHPGAHHYYIHLTELPLPDLAAKSGDILAPLMPGAGHMVHMPSHAYIRVGRYKDAADANLKAIAADEEYITQCYTQGIYPLGYYPHNIHFLWTAATLMGDSKTAIAAAKKTAEKVSIGQLAEFQFMQDFASVPLQAYVRFGKWTEILTVPDPGDNLKHYKMIWHYSRGIAFVRKGNLEEALEELDLLKTITENPSYDSVYASINHSGAVADVAYHIVAAEYHSTNGESEKADFHFQKAIEAEEALTYTEPPSWHLSTRENYGAFLNTQHRFDEAEIIFKENLQNLRTNGWSLKGLSIAYSGQGKNVKAEETNTKFQESWKYADIDIDSSVF